GFCGNPAAPRRSGIRETLRRYVRSRGGCMNCPNENSLRAFYDGELDAANRSQIEQHLASCPECRARLHKTEIAADRVRAQIAALDEPSAAPDLDAHRALSRFKAEHEGAADRVSFLDRLFAQPWRPAWVAGFAVVLLVLGLDFSSVFN